MLVAVQGCSHGSLTAIYDSIAQFERVKNQRVKLLILCGDFQALRSTHDFASLAVPPKYHALGTFHQYYSGQRVAPVLTLVIGGNHEASNYMWELYHGGWLAPNIYYLGAAGSVLVDGLRIVGASGIYKQHDYGKGHFEKVPFNNSTLRSVYHIRQYDVLKLMQLPRTEPTVMLSHDWPISIAKYGDLRALLQRKPFFRDEINSNTLGSPPLLSLLKHIQPAYWFSAHLHVKFAALFQHPPDASGDDGGDVSRGYSAPNRINTAPSANPDEITISDGEDDLLNAPEANPDEITISDEEESAVILPSANPEEIAISDEEDEVVPIAVTAATGNPDEISIEADGEDEKAGNADEIAVSDDENENVVNPDEIAIEDAKNVKDGNGVDPTSSFQHTLGEAGPSLSASATAVGRVTKFLALDKCGPGKDFIQFLDLPAPNPSAENQPPRLTFDPHWLAITRALHPYLSTELHSRPAPEAHILSAMIEDEIERIRTDGLLVPGELSEADVASGAIPPLVWERDLIDVGRVQQFWPTAPAQGQPGGSDSAWYTNPQTEAFCGMLGVENKVNPTPSMPKK